MRDGFTKFKFLMKESDGELHEYKNITGSYYYDPDYCEIEYILDNFKNFLTSCGWNANAVEHVQYLDDDEWKNIITERGDWNTEKERSYRIRKGLPDEEM